MDDPRRLALEVLTRIERDEAFANLALASALDRADLDRRGRAFVTDLVYGTTRMRRACDHMVDRFLHDEVEPSVRSVLRMGAYQIHWGGVPAHAAVSATVAVAPRRVRGLCNAVLRRVSENEPNPPTRAIELSYPDWIIETLTADLGEADAVEALRVMNRPAPAVTREDGYHQDRASQLVSEVVADGLTNGAKVVDLCAAPGGKATAMASTGARVLAADRHQRRLNLVRSNAEGLGLDLEVVVADATQPPFRPASFDRVLVDAPCSGLGVLRRRADSRWRVTPDDVTELADLQLSMLIAALPLVASGGMLVYSVCTLTAAETTGVDEQFREATGAVPVGPPTAPWRVNGAGGLLLPQDLDAEGMAVFCYTVT